MRNLFSYSPKNLTANQITKLDQLVITHLPEYYEARSKQSFFGALFTKLEKALNQLIENDNDTKVKRMGLPIINIIRFLTIKFIRLLGFNQSPKEVWIYKQQHRIREEVDMMVYPLLPSKGISNEKLVEKIIAKIDDLTVLRDNIRKMPPLSIFTNKVKIEFLNLLKDEYYKFTSNGSKKKTRKGKHQVLMMYYLKEYAKLNNRFIDKSKYIELIHFLTDIDKRNIRKYWDCIIGDNEKSYAENIATIRPFFEGIEAHGILEMMDRDLRG